MHWKSEGKLTTTIDNYIVIAQILFSMMVMVIVFKYMAIQSYDLNQSFFVTALCIVFLMGMSYYSVSLKKYGTKAHFIIIFLDFFIITFLNIYTGYFELRFLLLIPIVISAIRLNLQINLVFAAGVGIINFILDVVFIHRIPQNYSLETDLMLIVVYFMIAWLIGNFVKIEDNIRNNLYSTQDILTKQSSLLRSLINEMPLCVVVIDKKEKIRHINQTALNHANILHKESEEFIGIDYKAYTDLLYQNYNYSDLLILETLHKGKVFFKEKIIVDNKFMEVIIKPIYDESENNIIYALSIFYDITAEELLNERLRSLEQMNLVGQMGASIAHEIKNPLTTIKGFLQFAQESEGKLTKAQLGLLISEIERCNSILTDVLSVSKKSTFQQTYCNLRELLERQLILVKNDAMRAKVQLVVDFTEVYLKVNEDEIKQLFLNLSRNAIEAMPTGGYLYLRLYETNENIILEIEDTGIGIREEILNNIGTPFLTTKKNGTGLGVSICQRIAESHQAKLKITSELDKGTKVRLIFLKEENNKAKLA